MLTEDSDQSGTVGLLVGIIVLVFAGIFFSLMADKQFKFSKSKVDLEAAIKDEGLQVEALRRQTEIARDEYEAKSGRSKQPALMDKARQEIATTNDRIRELRSQQADLTKAVEEEKAAFAEYRANFRKKVRQAAVGERLDKLEVVGGKVFQNVTIRRVSADGMEVSHSQGSLRLRPDDLPETWRQRFQWGADDLALAPKPKPASEKPEEKPASGRQEPVKQELGKPAAAEKPDKQLSNLRRDVSEAKRRLDRSELEVARVRKEAADSTVKMVPGSSETWDQRITRMESGIQAFKGQYMEARGRLAEVSPDDALLDELSTAK
ncbi:MAG TPA: hypothetical protein VGE67_11510 [Haloferula sp.]